jgi:hypothetical protein
VSKKKKPTEQCPFCKTTDYMKGERYNDTWYWECRNPPCMFKRAVERRDQLLKSA